ncbi:phage head closure protein [Pararhizobium mangrovi]|uniref:Head-tail adaptor protein n=1 Tax=Pararhizobium mangrovi TaxID=2590452 RepID=A0A506UHG1_9HYPH|nr:phage head closure protein [Pararhizobium mangrovi]TPW32757.1 head-tail adaptor protein [Pararhizobium mangrovi]
MPTLFLDAGMLNTRLALHAPVDTEDGSGGAVRRWRADAMVWGHVEPVSARGHERGGQEGQVITHRVTIRARTGMGPGLRFVRFARAFEIVAVHDPDESGRYLVCRCREVAP